MEMGGVGATLDPVEGAVRASLVRTARRPLVVGICGAQGSGKSTLADALAANLRAAGHKTALLSIDDLYKTKQARETLARDVHPLLGTRGVPGTHDMDLGIAVFDALDRGRSAPLPRFDKSRDDRMPQESWPSADGDTDVLIFEGWCVGAAPQPDAELAEPVNALERDEDSDGTWRAYANRLLAGDYRRAFDRIDLLVLLAAPGFEIVRTWRVQQEQDLRKRVDPNAPGVMSDDAIDRFVQHYERLTRHILREMPRRADLVIALDADRQATKITRRIGSPPVRRQSRGDPS